MSYLVSFRSYRRLFL